MPITLLPTAELELPRQLRPPVAPFGEVAGLLHLEVATAKSTPRREKAPCPLILLTDDDPATRLVIRRALERDGYRFIEAGNGVDALTALDTHNPDLVLLDAVMPEMDGFETCARLRTLPAGKDLPIVMITGLDHDRSVDEAYAAGATEFVAKPIHWAVLRQRVRRLIEASRTAREVRHLAHHDTLTGLPNRCLFLDRLGAALGRAKRTGEHLSVLLVDLDHFKVVNETLGHVAGDRLLRSMTERLLRAVRETDTVARLGGDEFAVLCEGVGGESDAATVASKVFSAFSRPLMLQGRELYVTGSVGIASYPNDGEDIGSLLKHADTAMYRAKANGRGRYEFFRAHMGEAAMRRLVMEGFLRRALERNEFHLVFQPQVDLSRQAVVGAEVLLRWQHPELGTVSPVEFVPVAEETGLIVPIGEWVLKKACQQAQAWMAKGLDPIRLSVNLSARQFNHPSLQPTLEDILRQTDYDPRLIELEITEQAAMESAEDTMTTLEALRARKLRIAIDDFGTGYSSLAYLKRFPLDTLKIDRSFVDGIPNDVDDVAIVRAILAMARSLGLKVVAEGVETEAQRDFLRAESCDEYQGFLFSPPVQAGRFEVMLRQ